jgi:Peptidyl-prolyl cis-trans isomerase (rotamase) - cyclophilin family
MEKNTNNKLSIIGMIMSVITIITLLSTLTLIIYGATTLFPKNSPSNTDDENIEDGGIYLDYTTNPIATITMEDGKEIKLELYPDMAPNTVINFIHLANSGFYDGLGFHRTMPNFVIQGGDPNGDGSGGPGYQIKGEFSSNNFKQNTLSHERGVISMARSDYGSGMEKYSYNTNGSQFFIITDTAKSLDGLYSAFGKVIEGIDVVDEISNVEVITRDENAESGIDEPVVHPKIANIRVETFEFDYGNPVTQEEFNYYQWLIEQYGDIQE